MNTQGIPINKIISVITSPLQLIALLFLLALFGTFKINQKYRNYFLIAIIATIITNASLLVISIYKKETETHTNLEKNKTQTSQTNSTSGDNSPIIVGPGSINFTVNNSQTSASSSN